MKGAPQTSEVTRFLDAWFAVRQYIQSTNFNRFQGAGLSATQFMTLNLLPDKGEGIAIGELARRMNLKPATVAKTVDSLESRNLLARVRSTVDKRIIHVQITDAGAELQTSAHSNFRAQIEVVFAAMLPGERSGLILGLESLVRAASPDSEPAASDPSVAPRVHPNDDPRALRSSRRSRPK